MRAWGWMILAVCAGLLGAGPALGGIYNPGEGEEGATYPDFIQNAAGRDFRDVILILRSIPVPMPQVDNPVRRRYVFEEEMLNRSSGAGAMRMADRLQGSAVLLRRRKFKEAELLLRPAAIMDPNERDNIPLQSNFATALHLSGQLDQAVVTLTPVVKEHWKKEWNDLPEARQQFYKSIGWSDALYDLYREYDTYYLKLLKLRLREQLTKKAGKGVVEPPDALFDDGKTPVRFVNEAGQFEAGKISASEKAKLPPRALPIVQQLVVWMPDDLRLFWLLGEMYNAQGGRQGIFAALQIFEDLSKYGPVSDNVKNQLRRRVGALTTAKAEIERKDVGGIDPILNKDADTGGSIDWYTVAVSVGAGFVLCLFVLWQLREIQRRRQARLGH